MNIWKDENTKGLCKALLCLKSENECMALLEDLCTIKEIMDMSQRLSVAKMLDKGISYAEISKQTGASTATISRVSKCYEYGAGGYKAVISKCSGSEKND